MLIRNAMEIQPHSVRGALISVSDYVLHVQRIEFCVNNANKRLAKNVKFLCYCLFLI